MEGLIALAVIAAIVRVGIFIFCPDLDALMSGGTNDQDDDYNSYNSSIQNTYDDENPFHATVGGSSAGGTIVNNASNNYGLNKSSDR